MDPFLMLQAKAAQARRRTDRPRQPLPVPDAPVVPTNAPQKPMAKCSFDWNSVFGWGGPKAQPPHPLPDTVHSLTTSRTPGPALQLPGTAKQQFFRDLAKKFMQRLGSTMGNLYQQVKPRTKTPAPLPRSDDYGGVSPL